MKVFSRSGAVAVMFLALACGSEDPATNGPKVDTKPQPPPVGIARLEPRRGPRTGGTVLVVRGYNFTPNAKVTIGGVDAQEVTVSDSQTLSLTTPAGEGKDEVDVVVTNSDGAKATFAKGFRYEALATDAAPAPVVETITPNSGPATGGTLALVRGSGFQDGAIVVVGGRPARQVTFVGADAISAVLPEAPVGTAKVAVTNPDGRSGLLLGGFAYYEPKNLAPAPQVHAISPKDGPLTGGQQVVVTGANFDEEVAAFIGGVPVELTSRSATELRFTTPAGRRGLADVAATNRDGQSGVLAGGYNYFAPPPNVLGVNPPWGEVERSTPVAIAGRHFAAGAKVRVAGKLLDGAVVASAELITITVPPGAQGGPADVTVENADGLAGTLVGGFTYTDLGHPPPAGALALTRLLPASGPNTGGTSVAAFGSGFAPGTVVQVGTERATRVTVRGTSSITFSAPAGAVGPADVTVTNPSGAKATLPRAFIFFDASSALPAPQLRSVVPNASPVVGGGTIAIAGANFARGARLFIGPSEAGDVTVRGPAMLTAQVPAGPLGTVDVVVVNPDGKSARLPGGFAYYEKSDTDKGPTIASVSPSSGSAASGATVTIAGTGFQAGAQVFVDGEPLAASEESDTKLVVALPPHAAGPVDVVVANPDGLSARAAGAFTYVLLAPEVQSIAPAIAPLSGGIDAVVSGAELVDGAEVFIGGVSASATYLDGRTLRIAVPPTSVAGFVDVTVRNPDGQTDTLPGAFEYREGYELGAAPRLVSVVPAKGPATGGTKAQLRGEGFAEGMTALVGGRAARVAVTSPTTATLVLPAGAVGAADVVVTNQDGQYASLLGGFTYLDPATMGPPPMLSGVTPNHGPASRATALFVTGAKFQAGALVFVRDALAENLLYVHPALVRGSAPVQAPGLADVSVTNPDGQTTTQADAFTYDPAPAVTGVAPDSGPSAGGTEILVSGEGFRTGAVVFVGGARAPTAAVLSPTVIQALTPAGAGGLADVKVVEPDGQSAVLAKAFRYVQPPAITEVFPATGPATGGTVLLVTGSAFAPGVKVTIGGVEATIDEASADALVVTAPAGQVGAADIEVVNPDGQRAKAATPFAYKDPATLGPAPQLRAMNPTKGPAAGGTYAAFFGETFDRGAMFLVGGRRVAKAKFVNLRTASGVVQGGTAGTMVRAVVTNPDGQSAVLADAFRFLSAEELPPAPKLLNVEPSQGSTFGGDSALAKGQELTPGSFVLISGEPQESTFAGTATVSFIAGPGPLGRHEVTLTTGEGQSVSLADAWEYIVPPPAILSVTPRSGPAIGGTEITVKGRNFQGGLTLKIGTREARNVRVNGPTELVATTPDGADGPAAITMQNPDGKSATLAGGEPNGFTYFAAPGITSVLPASGPTTGSTTITISGTFFRPNATVSVGGKPAIDVKRVSDGVLEAKVPAGAAGPAAVRVTNEDGQSGEKAGGFTYIPPQPAPGISGISPNTGPVAGGTTLIISGNGFQAGAVVKFGTANATDVRVLSPAAILCTTPGNDAGAVKVSVQNVDGQKAELLNGFTYLADGAFPALSVSAIVPNLGGAAGGTDVTVSGTGIKNGAELTIGGAAATEVVWLGPTALRAKTPAHANGLVDVVVTNPDGQTVTLRGGYRYGTSGRYAYPDRRMPPESVGSKDWATYIDFDKDGDSDVFLGRGDYYSYKPMLYRNDGGNFSDVTATAIPSWPQFWGGSSRHHVVADFDRDGDQDIVLIRDSNYSLYLQNNGGTFSLHNDRFPGGGDGEHRRAAVGDVNSDGFLDVVVSGWNTTEMVYFGRATPAGTFTLTRFGLSDLTNDVALGDVDKDGDLDCITANASDQQKVLYLNDGKGGFSRSSNFPVAAGNTSSVVLRDFSGDGSPDVLIGNYGQQDRMYENNGSGVFTEVTASKMPPETDLTSQTNAVDIDRDGDLDLVALRHNGNRLRVYLNDGTGRLADVTATNAPASLGEHNARFAEWLSPTPLTVGLAEEALRYDTTGDTFPDVFVVNQSQQNRFARNRGGQEAGLFAWSTESSLPEENEDGAVSAAGDLDGDGDVDIVKALWDGTLRLLFNDGAGNFFDRSNGRRPATRLITSDVRVFDPDEDGDLDILVATKQVTGIAGSGLVYLFVNDGAGNFTDESALRLPSANRSIPTGRISVLDFDQDGHLDVLVGEGSHYTGQVVRLWRNVGPGTLHDVTQNTGSIPSWGYGWYIQGMGIGDFDKDGYPDFALMRGGASALLSNAAGTGNFIERTSSHMPSPSSGRQGLVFDADADGDLDMFLVNWDSDRLRLNNGTGILSDVTTGNLPGQVDRSCAASLVDVDEDGQLDVVIAKNGGGECEETSFDGGWRDHQPRLLHNIGGGRFEDLTAKMPWITDNTRHVLAADFDADGHDDLFLTNAGQSRILFWRP